MKHILFGAATSVALILGVAVAPVVQAQPSDPQTTVLFVVDTSGSMYGTPLEQAKEALRAGIDALGPDQAAGLRSFAGNCGEGGELLVPVGTDNKSELQAAADQLRADGGTPTPDALRAAANDLPPTGDRTIILISDGQSSCGNPCAVAGELKTQFGIDFRVHAVGFNAPDAAESELSCIADATGGQYFTATNTAELSAAISSAVSNGSGDLPSGINCDAPTFIGIRGSGEGPQDKSLSYYQTNARTEKPFNPAGADNGMGGRLAPVFAYMQQQPSVNYAVNLISVAYPAIPVDFLDVTYREAEYASSVAIGADNLSRIMSALYAKCETKTRVALAGYSQGANVINKYLATTDAMAAQKVTTVDSVLFLGDPNTRAGRTGERYDGTANNELGAVASRLTSGDANIAGYLSANPNVTTSFCLSTDIVCDTSKGIDNFLIDKALGRDIHGSYGKPTTKITCPVNGEKNVVLSQCAALRVMNDLGYALPPVDKPPTLLQRGQQLLISVGGWLAKQPGLALFASDPQVIGNFETDEDGRAVLSVNVPADAELGEHHVIVEQGGRSVELPVTVVDSGPATDTPVFSFGPGDGVAPGNGGGGTGSGGLPFDTGSSGNLLGTGSGS